MGLLCGTGTSGGMRFFAKTIFLLMREILAAAASHTLQIKFAR
jgi:hypothetical protein